MTYLANPGPDGAQLGLQGRVRAGGGDSSGGWLWPQESKGATITSYDMGAYFEIWQTDRACGRPLVVEGEHLRFCDDKSTPGCFNLHDATWD
ncbi:hypothetical protein [Streptomyces vinaceus]|uniref:hypothetical protein n=1 Tax=Streptomyces vinaceus TaxID=1960 RepID=UPI0036C68D6E